ncbi:tetratricopeptide repeat protein [Wolbachia endosymbiont (group A) of Epistrophe grossularia]|uniref:tetratricopeptide repeat protein n=1 Tax=Wolbachia endosymbiont (group A) of Epistrophe grossularia TaxID=2954008 RepID=UPI0022326579|nr:tetratricopeptide repeat protein [Wolbachia endosymbiont (group A) of Epistrophe grossularia]
MFQTLQQSNSNITEEGIKQALDIISTKEYGNKALEILNVISYLAPKNIHTEMFLSLVSNERKLGAAIKLLKEYSVVNSSGKETSLNVNSLVQKIIRKSLEKQKKEGEVLKKALMLLCKDSINSSNLDHAISTWDHVSEYRGELVQEFSDLPNTIVSTLDNVGRHRESYLFAKRQCDLLKYSLGVDHIDTLKMRNNMALMLSNCGKYQESLDIFQEVYKKLK